MCIRSLGMECRRRWITCIDVKPGESPIHRRLGLALGHGMPGRCLSLISIAPSSHPGMASPIRNLERLDTQITCSVGTANRLAYL